jgi:deoxyribose-phosphate aldolase
MTDRFTNAEWAAQIAETQRHVFAALRAQEGEEKRRMRYEVPEVGSREFAKTVDHTLLKLDATAAQIDALCAEARVEGFKVCMLS